MLTLLSIVAFRYTDLISDAYLNWGLLNDFTKKTIKKTYQTEFNQINSNITDLQKNRSWIEKAYELNPTSEKTQIHQAAYSFVRGLRREAIKPLEPIDSYPPGRSFITIPDRYEYQLLHAQQLDLQGNLQDAVDAYRLGLAYGLGKTQYIDKINYFNSLARFHLASAIIENNSTGHYILAGKYFILSGQLERAKLILFELMDDPLFHSFSKENRSDTYYLLAILCDLSGEVKPALTYYQQAIISNPNSRLAYISLLYFLKENNGENNLPNVERQIELSGPEYIIGRQWPTRQVPQPKYLEIGARLIGYDLDRSLLADSLEFDIYLWWEIPNNIVVSGDEWVEVGKYWIQRQAVTNLFPNAGFEWGVSDDGIPYGLDYRLYRAPPENVYVADTARFGKVSSSLVAKNSNIFQDIAMASRRFPVDADSYYLMAGWLWDESGTANIGRNCWWEDNGGPYYIAYEETKPYRPSETWVHIANVEKPFPGEEPNACEVLLINYHSETKARWDDILFARIDVP
jgi:tetratricopeptide (TPR) repeat protein